MMLASFGGSQRRRCSRGVKLLPSGKSAVGGILDLCKITSLILPPYTPYRVYARKRCCSRISSFFRATHEKGFSLPRINLRLLLNPRSRCTASRSAFDSRVPRSLRMTIDIIRNCINLISSALSFLSTSEESKRECIASQLSSPT